MQNDMFLNSGASFSKCRVHRFDLWRVWSPEKPMAAFILLNPSTADETKNDPTVTRCQRYAESWGYGGLHVMNIFSLRSTDPKKLYNLPPGEVSLFDDNLDYFVRNGRSSGVVVCGWGNHASKIAPGYPEILCNYLTKMGIKLSALKINKDGSPQHPLYLAANLKPTKYEPKN